MLKKDQFKWNEDAQRAFDDLKAKLSTALVLGIPNFHEVFEIECDASGTGIGAVLMQQKRSLAYFSKALKDRALAKSTYEKELMALALAIQHWRPYLLGRKFKVYTDQKSLKHLLLQRAYTPDQQDRVAN